MRSRRMGTRSAPSPTASTRSTRSPRATSRWSCSTSASEPGPTLEAGADDYVVKPIGIAELRSRVRAALRRVQRPADEERELLRNGALAVDVSARTAVHDDAPLALTGGEFAVLAALLRAHGRVLSRQELLQAIFGDDAYRDPRAIDFHVHHLREKLAAAGGDGAVIATVRGAGYRIVE
jgi:DNA-binding response OmpR family regulator